MKKFYTTLVAVLAIVQFSHAQYWTGGPTGNMYYAGGNVGIGTTTPSSLLTLNATANNSIGGIRLFGYTYPSDLNYWSEGELAMMYNGVFKNVINNNGPTYFNGGNVGIGTPTPLTKLQVNGSAIFGSQGGVSGLTGYTNTVGISGDGTAAPSAAGIQFGDNASTASRQWGIYNSVNTIGAALGSLSFVVSSGVNTNALTGTTVMTLQRTGYVGIGTTTPQEALSVNGNIRSKQVKVETNNWPDYVFKPHYNLPSLLEVKTYIEKYQRLPDMPSEADVAKDGLNLGEMNKILTKKVEELTLYLIQKDTQLKAQEERLKKIENQLKTSTLDR